MVATLTLLFENSTLNMTPTGPIHHAQDAWQRLIEKVDEQDWPAGSLYVIATPIGNLADLTLRAWKALVRMDVIAAEDTRQSRSLMDAWGIRTPLSGGPPGTNEATAAQMIVQRLQAGERVGLISDAGSSWRKRPRWSHCEGGNTGGSARDPPSWSKRCCLRLDGMWGNYR